MRLAAISAAVLALVLASPVLAGKAHDAKKEDTPTVDKELWDDFFGTDPFERFEAFDREYERFRQEMLDLFRRSGHDLGALSARAPHLEVSETKNAYVVTLKLGEIDPKSLQLDLTDQRLTVSGTREAESVQMDAKGKVVGRSVRSVRFSESVYLPEPVDSRKMSAKVDGGVLIVRIPIKR